jgi:hypothetical protein
MKEIQLSRPELAFIVITRAFLGAGIALLFADWLGEKRNAVGATFALNETDQEFSHIHVKQTLIDLPKLRRVMPRWAHWPQFSGSELAASLWRP